MYCVFDIAKVYFSELQKYTTPSMKSERREETMWRRTVLMDSWVLAGLIFDRYTVHAAKNIPLFRMIPTFNETIATKRLLCCIDYVLATY